MARGQRARLWFQKSCESGRRGGRDQPAPSVHTRCSPGSSA
ncbi:hypothetical protein SLNWT_7017 [Streptomyces albus]|uniref:Uncharacterized protein n=1 Tax=Streptomyces albus (strain ATCC 21838 / DSM 41398 / FERM P-419 / JCM 4703 / NBRC 107858) TaxID=1081613 RepID=A0A0B5EX64_STRA4|nr:hypothetical protein SLNWT_7017 [Streptomyces albus]AOU81696.1 hypothetical protein SLNHY_7005 [Streptomyces albus]AYN37386.1 hypothetical protein DUI70_6893 [Streptomyces albus]